MKNNAEVWNVKMKTMSTLAKVSCLVLSLAGCLPSGDCAAAAKPNAAPSERPNVILIMSDDQGYGDLACHGNPDVKTPQLDRLAGEGVAFQNFHVDAYCTPTRLGPDDRPLLPPRGRLGQRLPAATCYAMAKSPWLMFSATTDIAPASSASGIWERTIPIARSTAASTNGLARETAASVARPTPGATTGSTTFLSTTGGPNPGPASRPMFSSLPPRTLSRPARTGPFFVYLTPYAVHSPESVPDLKWLAPYAGKVSPAVADFYATIANIDTNIGRLREFLKCEGLARNTILIFMTDNGSAQNPYPAGMRGKKGSEYEGGHRVPCFFSWPAGGIGPGRVDRLAAHLDLLPTLVDLCSLRLPKPIRFDGASLRPLLRDHQAAWPDRTLILGTVFNGVPLPRPKWAKSAVMREQWRLVNGEELYDISNDSRQRANVADAHPDIVVRLTADYEAYWRDVTLEVKDWTRTLGRPILGVDGQAELALCSEDWVCEDFKPCPWNQGAVAAGATAFGTWRFRVRTAGAYRVEVRRWPREADAPLAGVPAARKGLPDAWLRRKPVNNLLYGGTPRALPVARVSLITAGKIHTREVDPDACAASFTVDFSAGEQTLDARLGDASGKEITGAYYAYIRPISTRPSPP